MKIHSLNWPGSTIWLYLGEDRERQLGQIIGSLSPSLATRHDFQELEEATGLAFRATCSVINVFVHPDLLNQGYGVALYEALAQAAAERFDAPMVSSACFGSYISAEAKRVWASKSLDRRITVRGFCAWGGGS